jgi:hypothetical protein
MQWLRERERERENLPSGRLVLRTSHSIQIWSSCSRRDRVDTNTTEKMIKRKRIEIQAANR